VASENDFGKLQAEQYARRPDDLFLGEKIIPFRLLVHDPRNMKAYEEKWALHSGSDPKWTFSEAEMEKDLFEHRFGKHPLLEMILVSIPVLAEDKIPKAAAGEEQEVEKVHQSSRFVGNSYYSNGYDSDDSTYSTLQGDPLEMSNNETEAVILDRPRDRVLLEELWNFGSIGANKLPTTASLSGDIVANWNASDRSGVSPHSLLFPSSCLPPSFTQSSIFALML
jgi:hypothetical protein